MIPLSWSGRSADIGALRTHCIGCRTSPSAKMTAACATGRRRATSPSFVRSLSTWSPETGAPKPASVAGARRLPGTTPTCSRSSHAKLMREPWKDIRNAAKVLARDDELDALYTSLFRELLTYMMEDPRNITMGTHLLFCAKNIERVGDHATNIAETVHYVVTGESLRKERHDDAWSARARLNATAEGAE